MRQRNNDYAPSIQGKSAVQLRNNMDAELKEHGIKATAMFDKEANRACVMFKGHAGFNEKVAAMEVFTNIHDDFKLDNMNHTEKGTYIYFKAVW
jgi:hypothetical protein